MFTTAECGGRSVYYYVLAGEQTGGTAVFGAAVEYGEERTLLRALAVSREKVEQLLEAMARGTVTAVTARDVAEDGLAD